MSLPTRTTFDDVQKVCNYLSKKPMGATVKEAKAVIDSKYLDGRKLSALRSWGLIEGEDRLKLTQRGRDAIRNEGARMQEVLGQVIAEVAPYMAIVERAVHRQEYSVTAVEVASHWHEHFGDDCSRSEEILNDQAICFFQLSEGAGLGSLVVGRRGSPSRFEFEPSAASAVTDGDRKPVHTDSQQTASDVNSPEEQMASVNPVRKDGQSDLGALGQGIFIAHGKNRTPLDQLRRILDGFKVQYRVAVEEPNLGRPIGEKVKEVMQDCNCAILIFTADEEFHDAEGNTVWRPSENVVYEMGAAGYLYGKRIVILKEDAVVFPSNFKDLGYISFVKDQLESKSLELLRELIGFGILKVST
jgi:predicted nucleotide-binding protein